MELPVSTKYSCPFCGNKLNGKFSKCFNQFCRGKEFNIGNKVIYRLNPELGLGKIIKKLEIPYSKDLHEEDTLTLIKYKVLFPNKVIRIVHPIGLIHRVFKVNEHVMTNKGPGIINSSDFLIQKGILSYEVLFPNGNIEQIKETEIYSTQIPSLIEKISKKEIDNPHNFLIKYWAKLFHSYYTSYQIKCITNSRLTLMPHQINVAHRLSEDYFARMILADEVGLGKTIEAGIYLKEMMARNLAERILIIVPATLVKQWHFEMLNKFQINFQIYDGKKIKELEKNGALKSSKLYHNPFYHDNLILCSLQFARNPKHADLLSQISWDIVIFDEAHHLRRYLTNASSGAYRETLNYQLAKKISQNCEGLLLLTATPLQLHSFELYSLIELIHSEAFDNYGDFEHFRKNMPFINLLISNINNLNKLNTFEVKNTLKLLKDLNYISKTEKKEKILEKLNEHGFKDILIKKIEKDHELSQFLIRNRKKNVFFKELLNERIVKTILVNPTKQELDAYNEIRVYLAKIYISALSKQNVGLGFIVTTLQKLLTSSKQAFLRSLERRLEHIQELKNLYNEMEILKNEDLEYFNSEVEYQDIDADSALFEMGESNEIQNRTLDLLNQEKILREFYDKLKSIPHDSKTEAFLELIHRLYQQNNEEKVIVFTQFIDTLFHLKKVIQNQNGAYNVEIFYGGMSTREKSEAVKNFRKNKKFSILLSTEIGGEGRNFQFCKILINFDLPWNPMKLEQRIGRLDRIGQESKKIFIYNFFIEGTIETDIIFALNKRIHLFEESIGALEPILGKIEKNIQELVFSDIKEKPKKLFEFNRELEQHVKKVQELEMKLDDLLIDKKSFQMDGLLTSLATCGDVKLTYDELFLLIDSFFNLDEGKYGLLRNEEVKEDLEVENKSIINRITLRKPFLEFLDNGLLESYTGTFNLDLARKREDLDFFALGHPLINAILDYCISDSFKGSVSILKIKKNSLPPTIISEISKYEILYLFIFNVKFQGYISEEQVVPIVVDVSGNELPLTTSYILEIKNFKNIFMFDDMDSTKLEFNLCLIHSLKVRAKKLMKQKFNQWKREIKRLNDKIFQKELTKKEKIHEHEKRVLTRKLESLKQKFERKNNQKPTERQMRNIHELKDEKKKAKKLKDIEKLMEQIKILENDILKTEKKLDDLAFWYSDLKNEMMRRNFSKFYTNLEMFAKIILT
ncbi:MAG: SNF2-related protein [Promethearchaeota archaeon]